MLSNLFKPKWQSSKPDVRIQAIESLDLAEENGQHTIVLLARDDEDPGVRLAALQRIERPGVLIDLLRNEKHGDTRAKAIDHVVSLLEDNNGIDQDIEPLLKSLGPSMLPLVAEKTDNPRLAMLSISCIDDEPLLAHYAISLSASTARIAAANKLKSEAVLEKVLKASKGKDKGVFRVARDKLTGLRSQHKDEANTEQELATVCNDIEALAHAVFEPLYRARAEHLHQQWQRLQSRAGHEYCQRFNRAWELVQLTVKDNELEAGKLQAEAQKRGLAANDQVAAIERLEDALKQIQQKVPLESKEITALASLLAGEQARWNKAGAVSDPDPDEIKRFNKVTGQLGNALKGLQRLNQRKEAIAEVARNILEPNIADSDQLRRLRKKLDGLCKDIFWSSELPVPDVLATGKKAIEQFDVMKDKLKAQEKDLLKRFEGKINDIKIEIEIGHLKMSNQLLKDANRILKQLPQNKITRYQKELRQFAAQIGELRDWQGFATTPKKEQLCREMEGLIGSGEDLQELSNQIKKVQEEWHKLGYSDKESSRDLWNRFKAASDKAYEPCKVHFRELAVTRGKNLEARESICQQLEAYLKDYAWEDADWRAVNEVYEVAKQEWKRYSPVDRKVGKSIQRRFDGSLGALGDKLQGEYAANENLRRKIIEDAEKLLELPDIQQAIDQVKKLQQQWKETGMVSRRNDQKLWKHFRAVCNGLFERRDQVREAAQSEKEQKALRSGVICEQIENLLEAGNRSVEGVTAVLQQLQKEFDGLSPGGRVVKRYKAACDYVYNGLRALRIEERQKRFVELWRQVELLDEFEASLLADDSVTQAGILEEQGGEMEEEPVRSWDPNVEEQLPEGSAALLKKRYEQASELRESANRVTTDLLDKNRERLGQLCIQLEILGGVESPAEDRQKRMEMQVSRLSNGFGQRGNGGLSFAEQVEHLEIQWCGIGLVEINTRQLLTARFKGLLKSFGEMA